MPRQVFSPSRPIWQRTVCVPRTSYGTHAVGKKATGKRGSGLYAGTYRRSRSP
jgi:hypothetical protein